VSRRITPTRPAPPRRSVLPLALAGLAALLCGFLLGHSTAPSPPPPGARAAIPAPTGAARALAGVSVGFRDTAAGAAAAAASYQQAFADPAILRPGVLRARIRVVATPDYAARMLAANFPGARRIATGPIGIGLRRGLQTLYAAVPVGYRVLSFSSGRAEVELWGFTLLGNASSVAPAAYFGLTRTTLLWLGGRWRIAATRGGFGPTPRLGTPPGPFGPYRVLDLAQRLRSYELAP
jgi:hypothetical protein